MCCRFLRTALLSFDSRFNVVPLEDLWVMSLKLTGLHRLSWGGGVYEMHCLGNWTTASGCRYSPVRSKCQSLFAEAAKKFRLSTNSQGVTNATRKECFCFLLMYSAREMLIYLFHFDEEPLNTCGYWMHGTYRLEHKNSHRSHFLSLAIPKYIDYTVLAYSYSVSLLDLIWLTPMSCDSLPPNSPLWKTRCLMSFIVWHKAQFRETLYFFYRSAVMCLPLLNPEMQTSCSSARIRPVLKMMCPVTHRWHMLLERAM